MIKTVIGRKITVIYIKKLDTDHSEYGDIINSSTISISLDEMYGVWNESYIETVQGKTGKYLRSFITDDNRSLSVSSSFSKKLK